MTEKLVLHIRNITKDYVGVKALDNVSFDAHGGQVLGLVGVNGAGKSTLMNILGGITAPTSGELYLNDQKLDIRSPQDSEALGIGFIHQEPVMFSHMTVAENISITKLGKTVNYKRIAQTARKYLDMVGSRVSPKALISSLPIGERQMVAIARALSEGGKILLFDEPTSSFTVEEKKMLFEVIRALKQRGAIIFYISHFLDEVEEICDRIVVMRDGRKVLDEDNGNVTRLQILQNMISGEIAEVAEQRCEPGDVVLKVENLSVKNVLNNVSLEVRSGEIVGLWGLMGSGRTELLRAIYGLDKVDSGTVMIADEQGKLKKLTRKNVHKYCGFLTESRHDDGVFLPWSIWENIAAPNLRQFLRRKLFLDFRQQRAAAKKFSDMVHVKTPNVDVRVEQLSGGNQQKVILAKWLMRAPKLFLLDEPTRGVDVGAKAEIQRMLCEFSKGNTGMLVVSSELEELSTLSSRILVINQGAIVADIPKDSINKDAIMAYCV